jgi:hypothetical protein
MDYEPPRRLVLVDFDWQDADLVPELLQQPGVSVRLVAGAGPQDAGVRLAELCGLPRTHDLADLTREIFDLALVSERSPRRTQIEGLLLALGTPSLSPQSFLAGGAGNGELTPAVEAPLALHAAAFETTLGGADFDALVEQALPDVSDDAPTAPRPVVPRGGLPKALPSLDEFPSPESRQGLEVALRALMSDTGAEGAEIRLGTGEGMERVVQLGAPDALLEGVIRMAIEQDAPQVVRTISGTGRGKAWGAWPFRTGQRHGVVAAAGIHPIEGWEAWERTVQELRDTWDREERGGMAPDPAQASGPRSGWLGVPDFAARLELARQRNRREGTRIAVHRLVFAGSNAAFEHIAERLPQQLRDTDCLCQPRPFQALLLFAGSAQRFGPLRRRIAGLWQDAWLGAGNQPPIPQIDEQHLELVMPAGAERFVAGVGEWLATA